MSGPSGAALARGPYPRVVVDGGTYWAGVRGRLPWALLVGLVPALLLIWLGEGVGVALAAGSVTAASVALVPSRQEDRGPG